MIADMIFAVLILIVAIFYRFRVINQIDNIFHFKGILMQFSVVVGGVIAIFLLLWYIGVSTSLYESSGFWGLYTVFFQTNPSILEVNFSSKIFLAVTALTGSILCGGVLISMFTNMIYIRTKRVENGSIRYKYLREHIVIIGVNENFEAVINNCDYDIFSDNNNSRKKKVVILTSKPAQEVCHRIQMIRSALLQRSIIYSGNVTENNYLNELYLHRAYRIYIIGDKTIGNCDLENVEICNKLCKILGGRKKRALIFLSYSNALFLRFLDKGVNSRIQIFNPSELWCTKLWGIHPFIAEIEKPNRDNPFEKIDRGRITEQSDNSPSVVICGLNRMGVEVLKMTTLICHYPNYSLGLKTKIRVFATKKEIERLEETYIGFSLIEDVIVDIYECAHNNSLINEVINYLDSCPSAYTSLIISSDHEWNYLLLDRLAQSGRLDNISTLVDNEQMTTYSRMVNCDQERFASVRTFGHIASSIDLSIVALLMNTVYEKIGNEELGAFRTIEPILLHAMFNALPATLRSVGVRVEKKKTEEVFFIDGFFAEADWLIIDDVLDRVQIACSAIYLTHRLSKEEVSVLAKKLIEIVSEVFDLIYIRCYE